MRLPLFGLVSLAGATPLSPITLDGESIPVFVVRPGLASPGSASARVPETGRAAGVWIERHAPGTGSSTEARLVDRGRVVYRARADSGLDVLLDADAATAVVVGDGPIEIVQRDASAVWKARSVGRPARWVQPYAVLPGGRWMLARVGDRAKNAAAWSHVMISLASGATRPVRDLERGVDAAVVDPAAGGIFALTAAPDGRLRILRIDETGATRRLDLALASRQARLSLCTAADDSVLVLVTRQEGTLVVDSRSLRVRGQRLWRGGAAAGSIAAAACSPDGRYAAVPAPHRGHVGVIRLAESRAVADIHVPNGRRPLRLRWSREGIVISALGLPSETGGPTP
jgi:hypothetical protein